MKSVKIAACLLSAAIVVSLAGSFTASAAASEAGGTAPHTIFVTFNGDAKTSRGFTWFTNSSGLASQVQYSTKSDMSNATIVTGSASYEVDGGDRSIGDGVTSDGTTMTPTADVIKVYGHKATISGLTPGTKYYYKVGDSAKGWSQEGSFMTEAASNSSFNFIDVTDTQAAFNDSDYYSNWEPLLKKAFDTSPDAAFVMDNGDITNNGGDINQWYDFANAAQSQLMNTTFVPVAGNHETYLAKTSGSYLSITNNSYATSGGSHVSQTCGPYLDSFINHFNLSLPTSESTANEHQGAYYDFNYGNALVMVVNTNLLNADGTLTAEQLNWMKSECQNSTQKWKIVSFHRAIQSIGSHIADVDVQALRAQLLPIMAQDGIDLVLQGHDHTYVRSQQIGTSGTPVTSPTEIKETYSGVSTTFGVNPSGTVYVINGASNDKFYVDNYNAAGFETASKNVYPAVMYPNKAGNTLDEANDPTGGTVASLPTYAVVRVDGDKLVVTTYQYSVDTNSQTILDSYGLAKPDESALIAQISALPDVSSLKSTDAAAVNAAYTAYKALDTVDQSVVTNSSKLITLVNAINATPTAGAANLSTTSSNPKTGENNATTIILMAVCGAVFLLAVVLDRKKKEDNRKTTK